MQLRAYLLRIFGIVTGTLLQTKLRIQQTYARLHYSSCASTALRIVYLNNRACLSFAPSFMYKLLGLRIIKENLRSIAFQALLRSKIKTQRLSTRVQRSTAGSGVERAMCSAPLTGSLWAVT